MNTIKLNKFTCGGLGEAGEQKKKIKKKKKTRQLLHGGA